MRANIPATAPPLDKPVFVTRPFFGIDNDSPLNEEEDYYSDEEDEDLQEALEQQEYDSGESASTFSNTHTDPRSFFSFISRHSISYPTLDFSTCSSISQCHLSNYETSNPRLNHDPKLNAAIDTQALTTNTGDIQAAV